MIKNIKLGTKLIGGFILVSLMIAIVGVTGLVGIKTMGSAFDTAMEDEFPLADASMDSMIALISGRDLMGEFMLNEDPEKLKETELEFNKSISDFDQSAEYIINNGSEELKKLAQKADEYHSVFQENSVELMEHQRLHIEAEQKADRTMKDFDQHADELKKMLSAYEEKLTSITAIDEKVDASMEAKTIMVEQVALAEEYMSTESLADTGHLRKKFKEKDSEFDTLEALLTEDIKQEHQDLGELAKELFDHHDETLKMLAETKKHMALVDEYSEKADLTMDKVEELAGKNMDFAMDIADNASVKATRSIIGITIVGFVLGIGFGFFLSRSITKPVQGVVNSLTDLSQGEGDLTTRLPVLTQDEIGQLSKRFNEFMEKLHQMITEISQGVATLSKSSSEMASGAEDMFNSSEQTSDKANTVSAASEEMTANMDSVAAAMEQSSTNVNTVASAAEEMNSTITEIARNAETAREVAVNAVSKVTESTEKMNELGGAANAIGKVVETITDISEQVNLLSLNATIEAARAGEAGKGFAVVASEIKDLAKQTSEASMDIKTKIESIQISSEGSLSSMEEISKVISDVNDIVSTIATAVEEQSSATSEISENISQASVGIEEVNENVNQSSSVAAEITRDISDVNQSSSEIAERSNQVKLGADDLSQLAVKLDQMVCRFKI